MDDFEDRSKPFYQRSLQLLQAAHVPFLAGGAYAFCIYTGITRHTKDLDLFVRQRDFARALNTFCEAGYRAEKTFPHWLGKAFGDEDSIDIIYQAGNGLCPVDDLWFDRAPEAELFDLPVRLTPPEEMICMKADIMERERYDGADVAHLLFHCARQIDWSHLLRCFGPDWRILLTHLILFGFIYPTEGNRIPAKFLQELVRRLENDEPTNGQPPLCRGTLLSRVQFLPDLQTGHFRDARLEPRAGLSAAEIEAWTQAAGASAKPHLAAQED